MVMRSASEQREKHYGLGFKPATKRHDALGDEDSIAFASKGGSFNAQSYLEKFGWSHGRGLGKKGDGRKSYLKVTTKLDVSGIGAHQKGQSKSFENLFNVMASKINIVCADSSDESDSSSSSESDNSSSADAQQKRKKRKKGSKDEEDKKQKNKRKKEKEKKKRKSSHAEMEIVSSSDSGSEVTSMSNSINFLTIFQDNMLGKHSSSPSVQTLYGFVRATRHTFNSGVMLDPTSATPTITTMESSTPTTKLNPMYAQRSVGKHARLAKFETNPKE